MASVEQDKDIDEHPYEAHVRGTSVCSDPQLVRAEVKRGQVLYQSACLSSLY